MGAGKKHGTWNMEQEAESSHLELQAGSRE